MTSMLSGKIIVFEGPDGVGKTSLSNMLHSYLTNRGIATRLFSFPGKECSYLGSLVYDLHHLVTSGAANVDSCSLQLLHVAAHIDLLNNHILPAINDGYCVILDRYWWSVLVYGLQDKVQASLLRRIISFENIFWNDLRPDVIFLIERELKDENYNALAKEYMKVYNEEAVHGNVKLIHNISLQKTFDVVIKTLKN
jgi:Thymidylate kinase